MVYPAANRDEEVWERSEELDVTRAPDTTYVTFGFGEHFCLGAPLARRKYPIPDQAHARNALARVAQNGTPAEQKKVKAAVKKRFPSIGKKKKKK